MINVVSAVFDRYAVYDTPPIRISGETATRSAMVGVGVKPMVRIGNFQHMQMTA